MNTKFAAIVALFVLALLPMNAFAQSWTIVTERRDRQPTRCTALADVPPYAIHYVHDVGASPYFILVGLQEEEMAKNDQVQVNVEGRFVGIFHYVNILLSERTFNAARFRVDLEAGRLITFRIFNENRAVRLPPFTNRNRQAWAQCNNSGNRSRHR